MVVIASAFNSLVSTIKDGVRGLTPMVLLVIITLIGGFVFQALEGPHEEFELRRLKRERQELLEETAFRLNTIKHMTPLEAYNHTVDTLLHYRNQLGVGEVHLNETKWTIWGAIYYSMTIYTTIGYGNITPKTTVGRVATIIYAFIGIPLALISLFALGSLLAKLCMFLWKSLLRTCGCFSKKLERKMTQLGTTREEDEESEDNSEDLLNFPVTLLIFFTICWIFFCAYVFLLWEESWDYGTSLYFVLISFTTIGFGDVLVSKSKYIIPVGCLILIGLALVSTVLTIIQKQMEAVASGVRDSIDKDYMAALEMSEDKGDDVEGGAEGESKKNKGIDDVISRMPLKSRLLYRFMPSGNRKTLAKHLKQRSRIVVTPVQTDPWLMEGMGGGVAHENINY